MEKKTKEEILVDIGDFTSRMISEHNNPTATNKIVSLVSDYFDEAAQENRELREWKESAMEIMRNIDLQGCAKVIGLKLGEDISDKILPALKRITERVKELESMLEIERKHRTDKHSF